MSLPPVVSDPASCPKAPVGSVWTTHRFGEEQFSPEIGYYEICRYCEGRKP